MIKTRFLFKKLLPSRFQLFLLTAGVFFSFYTFPCFAQPVASPDIKCIAVQITGDVSLTWTTPADPGGTFLDYKIYSSLVPGGPYNLVTTVSAYSQTTYTHIGANANASRIYYLIQSESTGPVLTAPADTFSTIFLSTNSGSGPALLSWNKISFQSIPTSSGWYKIYREYPAGTWLLIDSTQGLSYSDVIYFCRANLNYRIEISDNTGCSSVSNVKGGLFLDKTPPAIAPIDTVSVNAGNFATISWNSSPSIDADSVIIYKLFSPVWTQIASVKTPLTSYTYTGSNAGTVSEVFRIAFKDSCGNLSAMGVQHQTIYLTATFDVCAATASLIWNRYINMSVAVNQYQVLKSTNAGPFILVGTTTASDTDFVDNGLTLGTSYCYIVRASNGTKTSSSNRSCFFATVSAPPLFTYNRNASVLSDRSIKITAHVDPSPSIKNYRIQRAPAAGGSFSIVTTVPRPTGSAFSYVDKTVITTTNSYAYKIEAMDSCDHIITTSNLDTTILLKASISPNLNIDLSWNDYSGWLGGVDHYEIYRAVDGVWDPVPVIISYTGNGGTYTDDVAPYFSTSRGIFYYYVMAVEGSGNTFGFMDSSFSNVAKVLEYPKAYVPNAFTPNQDFKNDVFLPQIGFIEPGNYSLTIFDNTGTPIFASSNLLEGWDGKKKGHPCMEGVYMYLITCRGSSGDDSKFYGTLTLFR